jgi:hypothetical protein
MIIGGAKLVVVERSHDGMNADSFESWFEIVERTLDNGRMGDGSWGSPAHAKALVAITAHIKEIQGQIKKEQRNESRRVARLEARRREP